jgi:hypothetical protein
VGEQALEQLDDWATIELVALRLSNLLASSGTTGAATLVQLLHPTTSRLAGNLLTSLRADLATADGLGAAALGCLAALRLTSVTLSLEQVLDVVEQVANRGRPALAAFLATASLFAASRLRTASRLHAACLFTTSGFGAAALASFFAAGDLGASFALAAATAVQPEHAIQEFKAEPLAAQGYAHQERSKNRLAFH